MPNPPWLRRAVLLRAAVAVLAGLAVYSSMGDSGEGALTVEIRDQATGRVVPAMVSITSLADGKWRTPPDGRTVPRYTTTRDFYAPGEWRRGDVGPVRLTNGEYNDNDVRSYAYQGGPCYPFWKEPAAYFVSKPFTITLPAGKWRT